MAEPKKKKGAGGRPPFEPKKEERFAVKIMAATGIPHDAIAEAVGITKPTLKKYFADELKNGKTQTNARMAQSIYRQGMKGNMTAAIFWMKTQAGWKETVVNEHTGKDGKDLPAIQVSVVNAPSDG
jgi:DNA invertase Pin-like site-specific DNA recombinase